jgi:alanyl-tRNA synthetase
MTSAPTDRLYYRDATLHRFSATVTALSEDGRVVYLDRSAFYPTSGGQPHDTGSLADLPVVDVVDEDTRVAHHLREPLGLPVGAMVVGQVDAARRLDHMQQHTGQHLLSAVLADEFGWPTVSVHFSDESSTVDVTAPDVTPAHLETIEARVNAIAAEARPVRVTFEDAAEATGLRKPSDRDGELRIVSIDGIDRSACGGTHVSSTGAIGALLLRRAERTRGQVRLEFVCGRRAVTGARRDHDLLTRAARVLSASPLELPALVEQQQQRVLELERERRRLMQALASHEAQRAWHDAVPDADGVRRIMVPVSHPVKESEPFAQQCLALGGCLVLVANTATGGVLLASAHGGHDAGQTLRAALQRCGGRGGGSAQLAQGTVPPAQLDLLVTHLGFGPMSASPSTTDS